MSNRRETGRGGGFIRTFVRHPNAANLLMALFILGGIVGLMRLNTQFFPDLGIDVIQVSVVWSGAAAEDVDQAVVQAIEPEVRFLDGVKRVRSTSTEGKGVVTIEYEPGTDMQGALADAETAVAQVTTLPESSERPVVRRYVRYDTISRIIVSGPFTDTALKAFAKRMRDDLLMRGIDKVDLVGVRDEEVWVELEPQTLRQLNLTANDVARQIAAASLDLPAGGTRGGSERQVRALGLAETAQEVGEIKLTLAGGVTTRLREIANVYDSHAEGGVTASRDGEPAMELHIQRALNADALDLADTVNQYLDEIAPTLPPDLKVAQHDIAADLIRSRIELLLRNGATGLVLVLLMLLIFLNGRVAVWVASGIFIAVMGTLLIMLATGQSINMVSLFALIMALGLVVDDAIVVAEHSETLRRKGFAPMLAAETGARRMAIPIFASVLTTIVAFAPLLLISDVIGQVIAAIPLVIIAALTASLIECYLILPGHMKTALKSKEMASSRFRKWFDQRFDEFRDGRFRRMVAACLRWRYATLAVAIGSVIVSAGMMAGGRVGFVFFDAPEADKVYANLEMVSGTPRAETEAMLAEANRALRAVETRLTNGKGGLVIMAVGLTGSTAGALTPDLGDNMASMAVELKPSDERAVTARQFIDSWRNEIRRLPGLERLTIRPAVGGPPGADIDVRFSGGEAARLKAAAEEVAALLARYPGVSNIEDDLPLGKEEIRVSLTDRGQAMGFTTETVARQLRDVLEGAIAKRFPRGDEEVEVRVLYPRAAIPANVLDDVYLRGPTGLEAPLSTIVAQTEETGFARIRREDGVRQVSVTAEISKDITTNGKILEALERDGIAEIAARHGLNYRFAGKAEEQAQTLADMRLGASLALLAIYIILAWVFGSYAKPLIVMAVIPLGFVGTVFGHWLLGYNMSVLSLVALIGLSGVVVNDSIILVGTIKEKLDADEHETEFHAIVEGTRDRLRAVILTSATTIGGLAPMMFERSLQARFLIPMAITICFGLVVTTVLVLLVVPALMGVKTDLAKAVDRLVGRRPRERRAVKVPAP